MKKNFLSFIFAICIIMPYVFIFTACGYNSPDEETPTYNTVSFVTNGGSEIADKSVDVIQVAPTTLRNDYNFMGWFFDSLFTRPVTFPLSVDSDITLYASWEKTREKIISDCMAYIDEQENDRLFSQEDNTSQEHGVDVINTTVTHIGDNFSLDWEKGRGVLTESDNTVINEYDLELSFDYGDIEGATGYFTYTYGFWTANDELWAGLTATYTITSVEITGSSYFINGYYTMFTPYGSYDNTESEVLNSLQTNFRLALYDFQFLFPVEYWKTIFKF